MAPSEMDNATTTPPTDLGVDRPTAVELLEIISETLSETVVPATEPRAQHQARVAANLCRILARELTAERVGHDLDFEDSLIGCDDKTADAAMPRVLELVKAKLDVNKPGYHLHDSRSEADVIS